MHKRHQTVSDDLAAFFDCHAYDKNVRWTFFSCHAYDKNVRWMFFSCHAYDKNVQWTFFSKKNTASDQRPFGKEMFLAGGAAYFNRMAADSLEISFP